MPPVRRHRIKSNPSRLRSQTIARLRWIAVVGQLVAVLAVHYGLGFDLPLGACLTIIGVSALLNVFLRLRFPARYRLSTPLATALLTYDVLQLGALLFATGGIQNPFALLLIAPVTVSAATLPTLSTALIGVATLVTAALLLQFYLPMPWEPRGTIDMPLLYKVGELAAIFCGLMFLGLYARRLAKESRQMSDALAATELVLAREQKLHALDGLAAAAAHELGTPLATITVIAKEIERELPAGSAIADDISLLRSQAQRCREILETLTHRTAEGDPLHERLPLSHLIEEAVEPYRVFEKEIEVRAEPVPDVSGPAAEEPIAVRTPGMVHGLTNIVENAVDFAASRVEVAATWTAERVTITVTDDGPGFSPQVLGALGDPYVTSRPSASRDASERDDAGGLGLGFFIANTLLERSGAEIELSNMEAPATGAVVQISWARRAFESPGGQKQDGVNPRQMPA